MAPARMEISELEHAESANQYEPACSTARPDVSVLIVSYNTAHLLEPMFAALETASRGLAVETIVVDNASRDDSLAEIARIRPDAVCIANPTNVGFGRANNRALSRATGRYVLLLNTDAFVAPDALTTTIAYMDQVPTCGAVGVRVLDRNGALEPCCRYFPTPANSFVQRTLPSIAPLVPGLRMMDDMNWDHLGIRNCDWVPGCFLLLRREVVDRLGLFDERFFLYCEEVDLCRRITEAGYQVTFYGGTHAIHLGGESAKSDGELSAHGQLAEIQLESELLYFRKHFGVAGVLSHAALGFAGDLILAGKAALRGRLKTVNPSLREHTGELYRLLWHTRWGLRPTR